MVSNNYRQIFPIEVSREVAQSEMAYKWSFPRPVAHTPIIT